MNKGGGVRVPDEAQAPYLREAIGVSQTELAMMDLNEVECELGYAEGRKLARWMAD